MGRFPRGMNSARFVGIFDSGVGGLSVYREVARALPHERILYLADQAHVPYGARSLEEVRELSEGITRYLLTRGAKLVVVACNTASAAALHHLRRVFPGTPFVGMEPAVKPATEKTRSGVIGVIATEATFQGDLFASLIERYAGGVRVIARACPGLVGAVEAGAADTAETKTLLQQCLGPLVAAGIDQLVLGCTHYPFLERAVREIVGPDIAIIDPAPAVARQTARVLALRGLAGVSAAENHPVTWRQDVFCTTGNPGVFASTASQLLKVPGQELPVESLHWHGGSLVAGTS